MRIHKKVLRAYDRRQQEYEFMLKDKSDVKAMQRKASGGYRRPGSRNPRKVRG